MNQKRPLVLLLALSAIIAALWSFMALNAATTKTLDQRVQEVGSQLKCPICQGESVADSPSFLAQQMREVIREQLQAGKSESEVIQYFRTRYGEQIVWSPSWQGFSLLAWLVPLALLLGGTLLLFFTLRDWQTTSSMARRAALSRDKNVPVQEDEADLEQYRAQLEEELASEDTLFKHYRTEAR